MNGLQQVLWSEAARTFLLFQMSDLPCALYLNQKRVFAPSHLNFCSVLNYYTSELICFFHIHSVSAVLLLPLCATPYGSFTGLAPVIAACSYIYYYIRPMGVYGSPMNGTWENDEIWHTHRYGHK